MNEEFQRLLLQMPQSLEALYATSSPNETVELYSGELILSLNGQEMTGSGRILLKWLPSPRAIFEIDSLAGFVPLDEGDIYVPALNYSCPVSVLHSSLFSGPCGGSIRDQRVPVSGMVDRIIYHLPNFHHYTGDSIRNADATSAWRGRLVLRHGLWLIYLDAVPGAEQLRKVLAADGGFAITNVGSIQLEGNARFSLTEALDILDVLYYYFSFARGIWCGPLLPIAFDSGAKKWSRWEPPRIRQWRERRSWFPELDLGALQPLSDAFSGFIRLWEDTLWREPIKNAVHWYIEANTNAGGVEGGIVLVQTALELLSWVYLVEDEATKVMSANKFNGVPAEERIESLLRRLSIPTRLPEQLLALASAASTLEAEDGVGALVSLRNALVHPKKSKRQKVTEVGVSARIEALTLGLWYLELALLRLIGYNGVYWSRLRSGNNEQVRDTVPWMGAGEPAPPADG